MSATLVQQALIGRLQSMSGRPSLTYPNGYQSGTTLPRIVIQVSAAAQKTLSLDGITQVDAEIMARVETTEGTFAGDADAAVDQIVARFAVGDRFDGVTIIEAPNPRPPLFADGLYMVPVLIRGRGTF